MKKTALDRLQVYRDNVIVDPIIEEEAIADGRLVNPNQYEDKAFMGKVVKVGPRVIDVKVGDTIYFNRYSTTEFRLDGHTYVRLREEDVDAGISNK